MDITGFLESFREDLIALFGDDLLFLGIQGSHGRGEAGEASDIDPVIILRECGREELLKYRSYADTLPEKDILCGFLSSIDELNAWESADRAQLILDTKPIFNDLAALCPQITRDDIRRAALQGACAAYHAISHNIFHARDWSMLPELYKGARFTIRMKHYLRTGIYVSAFRDLAVLLDEEERRIAETRNPSTEDDAFRFLEWASGSIKEISRT